MRSPRSWLLVLVVLLAVGNLWATFRRSGIPAGWEGLVERIEVLREKHAGLDDVHLVTVSGHETHLDADVASAMRVGDEIRKAAWSTELHTPRGTHAIALSKDFRRMALAMPLIVALTLVLLGPGGPRRAETRED